MVDFGYRGSIYVNVEFYFSMWFIHFNFVKQAKKMKTKRKANYGEKKIEKLKEDSAE